jgi:hypothetical protein
MATLIPNNVPLTFICPAYDIQPPEGLFASISGICTLFNLESEAGRNYIYIFTDNLLFIQHMARVVSLYYGAELLVVPRETIDIRHLPDPLELTRS